MGLFDFFKKSPAADDDVALARAARQNRRVVDDDEDALDSELPQKQRARRRLIGAVVLVLGAVGLLPLVFDSQPKPLNPNITIHMPGQADVAETKPSAASLPVVTAPVAAPAAPVLKPAQVAGSASAVATTASAALDKGETLVSPAPASVAVAKAEAKAKPEVKPESKDAAKPDSKAEAKSDTKSDTKTEDKPTNSGTYIIAIGAFSSEEKARNWRAKMKEIKVPSFVEHKKLADGDRILLRAGPFKGRAAAEAAEKKLKTLGLSTKLVEKE